MARMGARGAKETAEQKIRYLEQQNAEMLRRLSSVEGHALNSNAQTLDERLQKAQRDIQQAEHFIAKATEAGNGEDVVAAALRQLPARLLFLEERELSVLEAKQPGGGLAVLDLICLCV